jgi:hypothetical protein
MLLSVKHDAFPFPTCDGVAEKVADAGNVWVWNNITK